MIFEHGRQREDVSRIVVHHQHLALAQHIVRAVQTFEQMLLRLRQLRDDAMKEQRGFVEQSLRRLNVLEHDALGHLLQSSLFFSREFLAGEDDDRNIAEPPVGLHLFQQVEAGHVRQSQIDHAAVEFAAR